MRCAVIALSAVVILVVPPAYAASVVARFGLDSPAAGPFPADVFTEPDDSQLTGLRVDLPAPDCTLHAPDCEDIAVLNELDGFSLWPRLAIPFSGPIDPNTASSANVVLVRLGRVADDTEVPRAIGINRRIWDPVTWTFFAEPEELLEQDARYALVVTKKVLDPGGKEVKAAKAFLDFIDETKLASTGDPELDVYRASLRNALAQIDAAGVVPRGRVVAASLFTTQSATAIAEKIHHQVRAETSVPPADFNLGPNAASTVFPIDSIASISWRRDLGGSSDLTTVALNLVKTTPRTVGTIAFGKYGSKDFLSHPAQVMPAIGTLSGEPAGIASEVYFNLFIPTGPTPSSGWPVVIVMHGAEDTKQLTLFRLGAAFAAKGLAALAINGVGAGFGPNGRLIVTRTAGGTVEFAAGGRSADQNSDGVIEPGEGIVAAPPRGITTVRDPLRQDIADLVYLVRTIERGLAANGEVAVLDPSRISFFGHSHGGRLGTMFVAIEPNVRAAALSAPGVSGPSPATSNMPARNQPTFTNNVAGAIEAQERIYRSVWAEQTSIEFAPHLRRFPVSGAPEKRVLVVFAMGDQTIPNPLTTAFLRAGDLAGSTIYFRSDLFLAANPTVPPQNPHAFVLGNVSPTAPIRAVAVAAQTRIADFLGGASLPVEDGLTAPYFEVPIEPPLPEELNFVVP